MCRLLSPISMHHDGTFDQDSCGRGHTQTFPDAQGFTAGLNYSVFTMQNQPLGPSDTGKRRNVSTGPTPQQVLTRRNG